MHLSFNLGQCAFSFMFSSKNTLWFSLFQISCSELSEVACSGGVDNKIVCDRYDVNGVSSLLVKCNNAKLLKRFCPIFDRNQVRRRRAKENVLSAVAVVAGLTKINLQTLMMELIKHRCSGLSAITEFRISWNFTIPSPLFNKS